MSSGIWVRVRLSIGDSFCYVESLKLDGKKGKIGFYFTFCVSHFAK